MHSKQILVWTRVWTVLLVLFQMFSPLFLALASYVPVRAESIVTDNTVTEVTPIVEPTVEPTLSPLPTPNPIIDIGSLGQVMSPMVTTYGVVEGAQCMETLYGRKLNCTANDVDIAKVENIKILDDGCQSYNDTVTFSADWYVKSTANQRYDVGLFFASDGDPNNDGAYTGSCSIATLPTTPIPPYFKYDNDYCGDIDQNTLLIYPFTLTVKCSDDNKDNKLDLPYGISWDQQSNDNDCKKETDAIPGSPAKCVSATGYSVPITVPYNAQIEIVKDLIPSSDIGRFNLSVVGVKTITNVGDGGTTGIVDVGAGTSKNPGATYTITEEAYTGTTLNDYLTSISCVDRSTGGVIIAESDNSLDLSVSKDQSILCTVTNSRKSGGLIVTKNLINDNGGIASITDFAFSINGGSNTYFEADGSNALTLTSGIYSIVESVTKPGYKVTYNNCTDIEVIPGQTATCTITNDDIPPSLILNKIIKNDNGGTALESNWTLKATGSSDAPTNLSGKGAVGTNDVVSGLTFKADTYTLSELADNGITGYTASNWSCVKNNDPAVEGDSITLGLGDTATCTITNDDVAPSLTLIKEVKNDNGGKAVAEDWTLTATGPVILSGTTGTTSDSTFKAGTYTLSESSNTLGYQSMGWACVGGVQDDDEITLKVGESATCTITNDDIQPKLTVDKIVKGGTALEDDFELYVTFKGSTDAVRVYDEVFKGFDAGTYVISEKNIDGYSASFVCDGQASNEITLNVGDDKDCSITNTRDEGKLTVHKLTDIDADGDYDYDSTQSNTLGFRWGYLGSTTDNSFGGTDILETGSYNVVENSVKDYHLVSWYVVDGENDSCSDPDGFAVTSAVASVTVTKGQTTELYFCNVRDTGTLQAQKTLDDQSQLSAWSFSIDGGTTKFSVDPDTGLVSFGNVLTNTKYVITEYGPDGYKVSTITGTNCTQAGDKAEAVVPTLGGSTTCVFNNQINKASLTIIKDAIPNDSKVFEFSALDNITYDQKLPATFNLDDDGNNTNTYSNTKTFDGLFPGEFSVSEKAVSGWKLTNITCTSATQDFSVKDNQEVKFTLAPGESMTCTFTNTKLGEVKALKYNDLNGDGDFIKDELPYLGGWEMTLYAGFDCQGTPLAVQTTQAGGPAVFSGLLPGNYSVKETMQSDWMATNGLCRNYTITAGQEISQKFGNFQLFDITGTKYEDRNKDGDQDAQELGIQGWKVELYKWNDNTSSYQKVAETVTDVNGWYKFMDLGPGYYKVVEESKTGWEFVTPLTGYHTFTAISGSDKDLDFGNVSKAKIIVDKVTVPSRDAQSFQFTLSDQSGVLQSFNLTDQATAKTLNVQRGTYSVAENTPTGWMLTSVICLDDAGAPVDVTAMTLDPAETVSCVFTNIKLGSIKVEKIALPEANELFDFTVTGGIDSTFQLQDNGNNADSFKDYKRFNNVEPVEYTITEGLESEWELIDLACDSDKRREILSTDQSITFTLKPGEDITCKFTNEKYSKIKVTKFNDYFGEGFYGPLDTPIENWGMQLYSGKNCLPGNKIGPMEYTDVNGEFRFTELLHGWYSVKEAVDPAWTNTTPLCQNTYLNPGDYDRLEFGNFKLGKVEGYKYDDINKDGDWDSDEPAVSGWKIEIYKNREYVGNTFTNGDGYYSFSNLGPGKYKTEEGEKYGWKAINPADGNYHFMLISGETKRLDFGNFSWGKIVLDKDTLPEWNMEKFTLNILQDGNEIIEHQLSDWDMPTTDIVSSRFTYSVTEDEKTGWDLSNLVCKNQGGEIKDPSGFELRPGEMVRCDFTNTLLGKLKVVKFSDDNGDGILNDGEDQLPEWGMNLYNTDNAYTLEQSTDSMGETFFNDLHIGHYVLSEDQQDGWELTGIYCVDNSIQDLRPRSIDPQIAMPLDVEHLDVYPGFDSNCYVGNQELGDVVVTKFNDVNGDGIWQKGDEEVFEEGFSLNNMVGEYSEEVLEGWMIHMEMITDNVEDDYTHLEPNFLMSKYTEETDSNGQAFFLDMPISKYRLYETQQEGWALTNIYCELDEEVSNFATTALLEPIEDEEYAGDYMLDLKAGDSYHCYIGNQITELYIDKTNDATAPLTIGDTTTFTIMVTLPEETSGGFTPAMLDDLMVKDLFSKGFKYIAGSNEVWVNGLPIIAPVPTYNSPGTWDLSSLTLEGGDEVKIQYQVKMVDPLNEGIYKDTAWAQANTAETGNQVLALDIVNKDFFVGTEVEVAQVLEPQEVTIPEEELPRTGSNIMILIASTALAGFGFALVLLGMAKRYTSRSTFKFLMTLIGVPMVMAIAAFMGAATAYALPYLDLQVQEQPALTSLSEFDITFVTMDLEGNDITATCYYNYDPVAPATFDTSNSFTPSIGSDFGTGNSGACQITPAITVFDGHYAFTVIVETATESETKTVNVEIDRNKPLQPVAYAKTAIDTCNNRIDFETAADGRTVSVDIFRSTATSFIADDTTRIASITKGPGETGSYTDTVPVCGTTYYYVIQAVDAYGNRSPFRGDQIVTIIDNTNGGGTTNGGTTAGGVAGEGTTAGGEEGTGAEVTPSGITIDTDEDGNVLGGTTDNTGGFNYTTFWVVIIGGLAVLGGIVYALSKKK